MAARGESKLMDKKSKRKLKQLAREMAKLTSDIESGKMTGEEAKKAAKPFIAAGDKLFREFKEQFAKRKKPKS